MTHPTPNPADDTQTDTDAHDPHAVTLAADADGLSAEQLEAALQALPAAAMDVPEDYRCGFVAIVGRPNVGKSTLMNHLIGQKISITSKKAQTTRHRVTGIQTTAKAQYIFVDTPGFQTRHRNALNEALNRSVKESLSDVDCVLFVLEAGRLSDADREVIALLPAHRPVVLVVNKADRVKGKADMANFLLKASASALKQFPDFNASLDAARDTIGTAIQVNLSMVTIEESEVNKKLAAWAGIFAVATAFAGVWGMNFKAMPELDWKYGYPVALVVIGATCLVLYRRFKRAGWL